MAAIEFEEVSYEQLNPAQQENYNYHKVSARLSDFGYTTIRLHDDFEGADFIAKHIDDKQLLKVQLKGRLTFDKGYFRRDKDHELYIAFRDEGDWFLYPHDTVYDTIVDECDIIEGTKAWDQKGTYHIGSLSSMQEEILEPYRLPKLE